MRSLILLLLAVPAAQPWGTEGHRIVARIAARRLTDSARAQVARLLGSGPDERSVADAMASASTWADEINKRETHTGEWHYIDIPLGSGRGALQERCPEGNCVTAKIEDFRATLAGRKQEPRWGPAEQLKFLIHFAGDMHQPLHCSNNADRGGNCVTTQAFHTKNLHAMWDYGMIQALGWNERDVAEQLDLRAKPSWAKGSVDDWAWQSHELAVKAIYKPLKIPREPALFPQRCEDAPPEIRDKPVNPDSKYLRNATPVIREQLARAGLRLARLLNEIWE